MYMYTHVHTDHILEEVWVFESRYVVDIRLHELIGQGIDARVATQLAEPQSHNLAVPSFDVAAVYVNGL